MKVQSTIKPDNIKILGERVLIRNNIAKQKKLKRMAIFKLYLSMTK